MIIFCLFCFLLIIISIDCRYIKLKTKHIYYWSPCLTEIATTKAVINSAYSINRYSKDYKAYILDAVGEFSQQQEELDKKNLEIIKLYKFKYLSYLPKHGFFLSRISFSFIFILNFFRLKKIIQEKSPEYLIIHLSLFGRLKKNYLVCDNILKLSLTHLLFYWANFHCYKWANMNKQL